MSRPNFINSKVVYHDNSREYNIDARGKDLTSVIRALDAEDISPSDDLSPSVTSEFNSDIPLFKYIHVAVTDEKEREQIHKMVCNIVRLPKMQQVCDELYKLMKNGKVLCTINPESMLAELRRMGLPAADKTGFSDANFFHYYRAPKLD